MPFENIVYVEERKMLQQDVAKKYFCYAKAKRIIFTPPPPTPLSYMDVP